MTQSHETKIIEYQGFIGQACYIPDEGLYDGRVVNLERSFISFRGANEEELKKDLEDSVAFYNDFCKRYGVLPEIPYRMKDQDRIVRSAKALP